MTPPPDHVEEEPSAQAPDGARTPQFAWLSPLPTLAMAVAVVVGGVALAVGMAYNAGILLLWCGALVAVARRLRWWFIVGSPLRHRRHQPGRRPGASRAQALTGVAFWTLLTIHVAPAIVNVQLDEAYAGVLASVIAAGVVAALASLFPPPRGVGSSIAVLSLASAALGWLLVPTFLLGPGDDAVAIEFPLEGEWYAFSAGRNPFLNRHYAVASQRHAQDLLIPYDRASVSTMDTYPSFGAVVTAPDGVVTAAVDHHPDLRIGSSDSQHPAGNYLVIRVAPKRYVLFAHLQQGSIAVAVGDRVEAGQVVARVGNSGNTSEPHLHIQVQDRPDFDRAARTLPLVYRGASLRRAGARSAPALVDLRRDDRIETVT